MGMFIKNTFIFFIIIFSSLISAKDFRFDHLNISNGLISSHVNKVFQDQKGFIWFGTDSGASKYDSSLFINYEYNPNGKYHISNNYIVDIEEDSYNSIWLATEIGINVIKENGDIVNYINNKNDNKSIPSNLVHDIFKDHNDNIWVATSKGVAKYEHKTENFIKYHIDSNTVYNINEYNSVLYFGTKNGLFFLNKSGYIEKLDLSSNKNVFNAIVITSHIDNQNRFWLGTEEHGAFVLNTDDNSITINKFNKNEKVQSIASYKDETYIGYANDGISVYKPSINDYQEIKSNKSKYSIKTDRIESLFFDTSGMMWVATRKGVFYYSSLKDGSSLYSVNSNDQYANDGTVYSLTEYKDTVILATSNWMKYLDKKDNFINNIKNDFSTDKVQVWTVEKDNDGNLWIAHNKGITIYNNLTKEVENYLNIEGNKYNLPTNEFYTVLPISNSKAWITGYDGVGLILFDKNKGVVKRFLDKNDNIYAAEGNYTIVKRIDNYGNIWLATTSGIIKVVEKDNKVFFYDNGIENLKVNDIFIDNANDVLWATTASIGLLKISNINSDTPKIQVINKNNGLPDFKLKSLYLNEGNLWIASQNKIFKYNLENRKFTEYPSIVTDHEIVFSEGSLKVYSDILYIGTNNGLLSIELNKVHVSDFRPQIHINKVKNNNYSFVNDKKVLVDIFDYDDNNITFDFSINDYNNPSGNVIKYKLVGFDKDWVVKKNIRSVSYTNLDAGNYEFVISGSNSDGVWYNDKENYLFIIKRPWWFYTIVVMGGIVSILLIGLFILRQKEIKTLEIRANFDNLTGLPNRSSFNIYLNKLIANKENVAVIFIDLDDFKGVNDSMGHAIGDELIFNAAMRLSNQLNKNEFVSRLSGDEFAIIINKLNIDTYKERVEMFSDVLSNDYILNEQIVKGSASIGVATYPHDALSVNDLLRYADVAMYESKKNGKNNNSYFNQKMNKEINEKIVIRKLLHYAIEENELSVVFQPKVCVKIDKVTSLEALVRWNSKKKGFISPAVFITEAENNGTINKIGEWVLRESCKQAAIWNKDGLLPKNISVNMSPLQFYQKDIVDIIQKALDDFKLPPEKLEIEITESVFINDVKDTLEIINRIKKLGVSIALDDFGTGYSSLSYLMEFPIDVLKIDRSFVKNLDKSKKNEMLIKNIFNIAEDINVDVVVEGVETKEQLDIISKYKFDLIQGYLYSPPINIEDATLLLKKSLISKNLYQ